MTYRSPQLYVIESIRNLDGTPHEREGRRIKQRVEVLRCEVGEPMRICYRDDHNKLTQTTPVINVFTDAEILVVYTENRVYTLGKVAVS